MRVLYFGTYERDYPRNSQVISCLRQAGVEVAERHVPIWEDKRHKLSLGARGMWRATRAQAQLAVSSAGDADVLMVGYPGHADVPAAKRVARGRPVIFNPLVSLADTMIGDRALVSPRGIVAKALRLLDRTAFRRSDLVVADTAAHAAYFARVFELPPERLAVCFVGADDRLFTPASRTNDGFTVLFVGKLTPLHGLETILEAAGLLPEITFHVVGSGQLDAVLARRPENVRQTHWVEYERLPDLYRSAGCALGVFGTSDKASRVIPNKAFHALATQTPLITADTSAARELLEDGHDALLVPAGDPEALANAISRLANTETLRWKLAAAGRATYVEQASEAVLGARWRSLVEDRLER